SVVRQSIGTLNRFNRPIVTSFAAVALLGALTAAGHHYVKSNTIEIYHVYVANEYIASINDPHIVDQYVARKTKEVSDSHPEAHMVLNSYEITIRSESKFKGEYNDSDALNALAANLTATALGVQLMIDGEVYAIVKDQETADLILDQFASRYVPEPEVAASGDVQI